MQTKCLAFKQFPVRSNCMFYLPPECQESVMNADNCISTPLCHPPPSEPLKYSNKKGLLDDLSVARGFVTATVFA